MIVVSNLELDRGLTIVDRFSYLDRLLTKDGSGHSHPLGSSGVRRSKALLAPTRCFTETTRLQQSAQFCCMVVKCVPKMFDGLKF